jgi:hypothetical protein
MNPSPTRPTRARPTLDAFPAARVFRRRANAIIVSPNTKKTAACAQPPCIHTRELMVSRTRS